VEGKWGRKSDVGTLSDRVKNMPMSWRELVNVTTGQAVITAGGETNATLPFALGAHDPRIPISTPRDTPSVIGSGPPHHRWWNNVVITSYHHHSTPTMETKL